MISGLFQMSGIARRHLADLPDDLENVATPTAKQAEAKEQFDLLKRDLKG